MNLKQLPVRPDFSSSTTRSFFAFICLLIATFSVAQMTVQSSYTHAFSGNASTLETGRLYQKYYFAEGHQFYDSQLPVKSSINLNGVWIDDILLNYDVYNNLVVYYKRKADHTQLPLIPYQPLIEEFKLDGSKFIKLEDTLGNQGMRFYELLYSNKDTHMVRTREKSMDLNRERRSGKAYGFTTKERDYLIINNDIFPIKRPGKLAKQLKKYDSRMKNIIENSSWRRDYFMEDLQRILDEYNQ